MKTNIIVLFVALCYFLSMHNKYWYCFDDSLKLAY